ncbi:MAG: hemerythrin HHE cation-binding protein [Proteobacteria bacterium]|nr:hemerythrin HHE cation-binding protein [Pseudomonadota bacterium]
MKRDPRLAQLSREHHTALRLGRKLLEGGASAALRAEQDALAAHFAEEEQRFVPLLQTQGEAVLAERLLREHEALRTLFTHAARGEREAETGHALIDHVRFEERELFPVIEGLLDAAS